MKIADLLGEATEYDKKQAVETDRCIQKKEKLPPKENSISFYLIRFFSIILPYSVQ